MILIEDFKAKANLLYANTDTRSLIKALLADGASAIVLYRAMRLAAKWHLTPLALIFQKLNKLFNHCVIGIHADFGKGLVIGHSTGIVINSSVRGGQMITFESGVVLGDNHGGSPTLGDRIYIGSGAKLIGAIHIGDGSKVGANAVVTKDVPAYNLAVGIPAVMRPLR
jgi:serine O-acetyltransferase